MCEHFCCTAALLHCCVQLSRPFQPSKLHQITFFSSTASSDKQLHHFYELLDPFRRNFKMQNQHFQHPSLYSFQPTEIHHGRKVLPHGPDFTVSTSGRAIPVATANQTVIPSKGSLFVGDISFFCTEADMVRLFEPYGRVLHVEVRRNAAGESLRHGFAELASVDAAQRAINDLHSSKFMGRRIRYVAAFKLSAVADLCLLQFDSESIGRVFTSISASPAIAPPGRRSTCPSALCVGRES